MPMRFAPTGSDELPLTPNHASADRSRTSNAAEMRNRPETDWLDSAYGSYDEELILSNREIEPSKENRAFAIWVVLAVIVFFLSIFVLMGVVRTIHPSVVTETNSSSMR